MVLFCETDLIWHSSDSYDSTLILFHFKPTETSFFDKLNYKASLYWSYILLSMELQMAQIEILMTIV